MSVLSQSVTSVCSAESVAFTWKTSSGKIQQGEQQDVFQLLSKRARHLEKAAMVEKTASRKNLRVNLRTEILLMWQIDLLQPHPLPVIAAYDAHMKVFIKVSHQHIPADDMDGWRQSIWWVAP